MATICQFTRAFRVRLGANFIVTDTRWLVSLLALVVTGAATAWPQEIRTPPAWQLEVRPLPVSLRLPQAPFQQNSARPKATTLVERSLWGAGAGLVALLLSASPAQDRGADWLPLAAYPVGAVVGITLVTRAREGSRPLGVVVGTALGAALPVLATLVVSDQSPNDMPSESRILLGFSYLVTVPLGGALGHSLLHKGHGR